MNNRKYLGWLGLLGLLGIEPLLKGDWFGALWLVWFVWFLFFVRPPVNAAKRAGGDEMINNIRVEVKQEAVDKVFEEIQKRGEMTNDEVQALLGVSDATAERYLQELESEGRIRQVGEIGQSVSYKVQ